MLVSVLIVTVVFNIVFIIDNSQRLRTDSKAVEGDDADDEIRNQDSLLASQEKKEGKDRVEDQIVYR